MRTKRLIFGSLIAVFIGAMAVLELSSPTYSANETLNKLISVSVTRALGGVAFMLVTLFFGYRVFGFNKSRASLLVALAALAVAVNNLPIIGLVSGNAAVSAPASHVALLALESLMIGFFEEFTFRGVLYTSILENRRGSSREIFLATLATSLAFGAIHLLNLFFGAGFGATLLQAGYSTLIGGMLSIVLLKTGSIWLCIAIHAVYDFCGYLVPTLGNGKIWDAATVTITAILGVAVLVFMLYTLHGVSADEAERLFSKKEKENDTYTEKL